MLPPTKEVPSGAAARLALTLWSGPLRHVRTRIHFTVRRTRGLPSFVLWLSHVLVCSQ